MEEEIILDDNKNNKEIEEINSLMNLGNVSNIIESKSFNNIFKQLKSDIKNEKLVKSAFNDSLDWKARFNLEKVDYYNGLPSEAEIKDIVSTYSSNSYFISNFLKYIGLKQTKNLFIDRDTKVYLNTLDDSLSLEEKLAKALIYVDAIKSRDIDKNSDKIKKISLEIIESIDKLGSFDTNTKEGLNKVIKAQSASLIYDQLRLADKTIYDEFKKKNPLKYYDIENKKALIYQIASNVKQDFYLKGKVVSTNGNLLDFKQGDGILSYSSFNSDKVQFGFINVERSAKELTNALYHASYSAADTYKFNPDVSVYGAFGNEFNSKYVMLNKSEKDLIALSNESNNVLASVQTVEYVMTSLVTTYTLSNLYKDLSLKGQYDLDKIAERSICINGETLYDLTEKCLEKNHDDLIGMKDLTKRNHARALVFLSAMNDPSKVITITNIKPYEDKLMPHTVILDKNYDKLIEACKNGHTIFDKFFHLFGKKYPEEIAAKTYKETIAQLNKTKYLNEITNKFETTYHKGLNILNSEIELRLDTNVSRKKLAIKELKEYKENIKTFTQEDKNNELSKNNEELSANQDEIDNLLKETNFKAENRVNKVPNIDYLSDLDKDIKTTNKKVDKKVNDNVINTNKEDLKEDNNIINSNNNIDLSNYIDKEEGLEYLLNKDLNNSNNVNMGNIISNDTRNDNAMRETNSKDESRDSIPGMSERD